MHQLTDADDARQTVAFWADQGATSFKAYMNITRAELEAAIDEAHSRGLKITGHLCSVTYPEAAALGIDDLEHGFFVNTQLDPGKQPDDARDAAGDADAAGDDARQRRGERADQTAGRPSRRGDLDPAGVRAERRRCTRRSTPGDGGADAARRARPTSTCAT